MDNVRKAFFVAERVHANQQYGIFPYMYHINSVYQIARELGYDESIQVACVLHDSLEDGDLSYNDIKTHFGKEVAEIVYAVTDELGRNRKERKAKTYPKIMGSVKATVVKVCDRIANVQHSKQFNPSLFEMYRSENKDFGTNLINSHPDVTKAFDKLNELWQQQEKQNQ